MTIYPQKNTIASDNHYHARNLPCMSSDELMQELLHHELLASNCISDHMSLNCSVIKACLYLSLIEPGL